MGCMNPWWDVYIHLVRMLPIHLWNHAGLTSEMLLRSPHLLDTFRRSYPLRSPRAIATSRQGILSHRRKRSLGAALKCSHILSTMSVSRHDNDVLIQCCMNYSWVDVGINKYCIINRLKPRRWPLLASAPHKYPLTHTGELGCGFRVLPWKVSHLLPDLFLENMHKLTIAYLMNCLVINTSASLSSSMSKQLPGPTYHSLGMSRLSSTVER